jgi:hypothetical protein
VNYVILRQAGPNDLRFTSIVQGLESGEEQKAVETAMQEGSGEGGQYYAIGFEEDAMLLFDAQPQLLVAPSGSEEPAPESEPDEPEAEPVPDPEV